jgi:hypothetical protein
MANELNLALDPAQTGLTVTAILIQGNAVVGSPISCPESGTVAGHYSGDMPAVAAGLYGVRFLSAGLQVGTGLIDWDGTKERGLGDVPTVAQVEARTLPSADYFNPAADTVATVTNLVNAVTLPSIPSSWITAAGVAADAVAEIQSGLLTSAGFAAALPANFGALGINASGHMSRVTLTDTTTANTDMRGTDGAATPETVWAYTTRTLTSAALSASDVWGYSGRTLDGTQAAAITSILEDTATTIPGLIAALPTLAQVQAAGFTTTRNDALISMEAYTRPMAKQLGLVSGISTTHSRTAIVVSDGDGSTTITDNGGGSYTVALT